jgi:hypothetical protein
MNDLYASLDIETRIVVQQRTSEIRILMQRTAQDLVEIGLAALGHYALPSSTSRTLRASASSSNGLDRKCTPSSSTPWCAMALSV